MRVRGILFDFDHTLVDSPIDFAAMRAGVLTLVAEAGARVEDADGKLVLELVEEAAGGLEPAEGQRLRAAAAAHILRIEMTAAEHARAVDGVPAALRELHRQGRRIAVITRNSRGVVDAVLARIPLVFDVLLCREDVAAVKPAPEHALAALAALEVPADEAILVGDFRGDIDCALRAGILPIGVTTGKAGEGDLLAAGAAFVLPSAAALPGWLAERGW